MCVSCVGIVQDIDTEPKRRCRGGFHDFRTVFKVEIGSFPATLRWLDPSVRLWRVRLWRSDPFLARRALGFFVKNENNEKPIRSSVLGVVPNDFSGF